MEKKILVSVDDSKAAQHAVDYVALINGKLVKELYVTLLHIMGSIPPFLRRESQKDPQTMRQLRAMEKRNRTAADEILSEAKQRLLDAGMPEENIELKALPRTSDIARDILFEAEHGLYDALVVGRRGGGLAKEIFMGSTTNKIVQHCERLPIWVVDGKVGNSKLLCAVDGSEGSLKAVDHMGFMLGGNPEAHLTLFHVGASLANYCPLDLSEEIGGKIEGDLMKSDQECMDDFMNRAYKVLDEAGIGPDQVEADDEEGHLGVSRAIVKKARKGGFGTIVLGRRGENRSFFLGHVSDKVMARAEGMAVWIVG
jgi:nucleotide-binding universal stress UspA family protein